MKTSAVQDVEFLRAEVRRLQTEMAQLQARLDEDSQPEEVWNVWPYTWFTAAYNASYDWIHDTEVRLNRWNLTRHNRRTVQSHCLDGNSHKTGVV